MGGKMIDICTIIPEGKDWLDVVAALFPVIISGLAVYFTYAQFKLFKKKRNLKLFDEIEEKYRAIGQFKSGGVPLHPRKTRNEMPEYKELIKYFSSLQNTVSKTFEKYMEVQE